MLNTRAPHQKQLRNPAALGVLKPVSSKPSLVEQSTSLQMAATVKAAAQNVPPGHELLKNDTLHEQKHRYTATDFPMFPPCHSAPLLSRGKPARDSGTHPVQENLPTRGAAAAAKQKKRRRRGRHNGQQSRSGPHLLAARGTVPPACTACHMPLPATTPPTGTLLPKATALRLGAHNIYMYIYLYLHTRKHLWR